MKLELLTKTFINMALVIDAISVDIILERGVK